MQGNGKGTRSRHLESSDGTKAAGLVCLVLTLVLVLPVAPGLCLSASAQPPGPELFAKALKLPSNSGMPSTTWCELIKSRRLCRTLTGS